MQETVLITGASSGIGLELARCFAGEGSNLILVARNQPALESLAAELVSRHKIQVQVLPGDLSQPDSPGRIFDELKGRGVAVDVLVNNAGFGLHGTFAKLPLAHQLQMVQVNISALVALTGLFLPAMVERHRGGILNVGSVAGFFPGPCMAVYFATKAFVQSFSEGLYEELRGTGVTITDLCPGPTESNFSKTARAYQALQRQSSKMAAATVAAAGLRAFRQRRCLYIPGARNVLLAGTAKIMPRSTLRKGVAHYNQVKA